MEFIYDYTEEQLVEVIKKALSEGYSLLLTEWVNEWEREEGCPSVCYELSEEEYKGYEEDVYSVLPDYSSNYSRGGCSELNLIKDGEYICFYHDEYEDNYICKEALDFMNS